MSKWKQGIVSITPFQMARITYWNTYIMIIGIKLGILFSYLGKVWWLLVVLTAALINTAVVQIGNYQKYVMLKQIERGLKNV